MIKVLKSPFELQALANAHYDVLENVFDISKKLDGILADPRLASCERSLYKALKKDLRKIIVSPPSELEKLNKTLKPLFQSYISKKTHGLKGRKRQAGVKVAKDKIFRVFDYSGFTKKDGGIYAYDFTENLDISVCVYCNRQYTFTLMTDDGKCRPTIDHFFDKGKHPYFALSFYNLIPSCYTCNSSLKNQVGFTLDKNMHPFLESMYGVLDFSVDISNVDFVDGIKKDFKITLKPSKSCTDTTLINKAQENAKIFKLEELYSGHKDYAAEIIQKSYYYDRSRIDELYKFETEKGNKLFDSRQEVIEFALGNYISQKKMGLRILSKFTRDLAFDLGMEKLL